MVGFQRLLVYMQITSLPAHTPTHSSSHWKCLLFRLSAFDKLRITTTHGKDEKKNRYRALPFILFFFCFTFISSSTVYGKRRVSEQTGYSQNEDRGRTTNTLSWARAVLAQSSKSGLSPPLLFPSFPHTYPSPCTYLYIGLSLHSGMHKNVALTK